MDYIDLPATTDSISLRETTILLVAEPQDLEKA